MFFDKKKIRRTRTRPTFQTELLESRAMFSATEMPAVDDCPVDDIGLDIPAYEKPYGQDDSASDWWQKWENAKDNAENVKEGWDLFWSDTDDLCTGVNEPEQIPAECFGECYAELDDPDLEDEEEDTKKGKKK